jgi:hypothetical protein
MKFLFLATALFALYGSVVCELPKEVYGLGFKVSVDAGDRTKTLITFEEATPIIFRTGLSTDTTTVSMVNMDDTTTELTPVTSTSKMGKKSAADNLLIKTYDLNGVKVTVDLTVSTCTTLTTETGASVSVDASSLNPKVKYTNNKNQFVLVETTSAAGVCSYTHDADGSGTALDAIIDVATNTITVGPTGSEKVFDLNGDEPADPDADPCVAPTTTCITDPCTSSYGWNQWCKF